MMDILLTLIVLAFIVYFWFDSMKAREQAEVAAKQLCLQLGVQFLDHSVAIKAIKFTRSSKGYIQFERHYGFEFTNDGTARHSGRAIMLGQRLKNLQADDPAGTIIEETHSNLP